jgi:hypothetical protein
MRFGCWRAALSDPMDAATAMALSVGSGSVQPKRGGGGEGGVRPYLTASVSHLQGAKFTTSMTRGETEQGRGWWN